MGMKRAARWRAVTVSVGAVTLAAGGRGPAVPAAGRVPRVAGERRADHRVRRVRARHRGTQTQAAINGFEKANPNIKVQVQVLSSDSTTYLSQLEHDFISGSSTPDVFESDVTYPAKFAQAGWVLPLTQFKPSMSQYFAHEVAAGTYNGTVYAMPWFDNPRACSTGPTWSRPRRPPPAQVVSDAEAAMKADKSLKEGLAFEADKYEGAITAFLTVDSAFGGTLDPANVNTPGNVAALKWLHDAVYTSKIAPQAVTGWQEGQVEEQFASGYTPFAIDYPFVEAQQLAPAVKGHVGYIPFPAGPGGTPGLGARRRDAGDQRQDRARRGGLQADPVPDQPLG